MLQIRGLNGISRIELINIVIVDIYHDGREISRDIVITATHIVCFYGPLHFMVGATRGDSIVVAGTVAGAKVFGRDDTHYFHRSKVHIGALLRKILRL